MNQLCYYNPALIAPSNDVLDVDVCIYGGNAAGVVAAIQAAKMGLKTVVLEPGAHLGGLTSGGLSQTDHGRKAAIGGLSLEFYQRCGTHYDQEEEWKFEPRVAEKVFVEWIENAGVPYYFHQFLCEVEMDGGRIRSIALEGGRRVRANYFIDCSYEGDLMARAGVSHHVGRESNEVYGETVNGAQMRESHQFDLPISPYIKDGDASSGLLPGIETTEYQQGVGDHRVQAYNFRLCLSRDPDNQVPFEKPEAYDPREYVLLERYFAAGWRHHMGKYDPIRGQKCDMNNSGAVSSDFIGRNFGYPAGSYAEREKIFQAHVTYQKGLMWFRSYGENVPDEVKADQREWALPADEFESTGGWPHQLYVRESRRMVADYVMIEADCRGERVCEDSIGLASYNMDSHNCRRFVKDGQVLNEGDVQLAVPPYPVSMRSLVPHKTECANLIVPVCMAASHISYGSIRMEPVFMILGQSAATIAALAVENKNALAVQDLPYEALRAQLQADGQVLETPAKKD